MADYDEREDLQEEEGSIFDDDFDEEELEALNEELDSEYDEEDYRPGWDGQSKPKPEMFDDYEQFYEAQADWVASKKIREAGMLPQPQTSPQENIRQLRKTLSSEDVKLFDDDQRIKSDLRGWKDEMQAAEDLGDQQRYDRASYWLREAQAELEDLYREAPELEAQKQVRTERALNYQEGLLKYGRMSEDQRRDPFWLGEAKECVEIQDATSDSEFSLAVSDDGKLYSISHPGVTAREATDLVLANQLTHEFPNHSRKLLAAQSRIGDAKNWTVRQISGEVGGRPAKPKAEAASEAQGDLILESARPGENNVIEHLDLDSEREQFEQQKKDQNRGPKPRTSIWSRM